MTTLDYEPVDADDDREAVYGDDIRQGLPWRCLNCKNLITDEHPDDHECA